MAIVNRLVSLGQRLKQTPIDRSDELADLYRPSIVLLHASFEDMLRTTLEIHVGYAPKRTFGKVVVVVKALRELGLDPIPFRSLFPEMSAFMARRHRIVHEADLPTANSVTSAPWTIVDDYQLVLWIFVIVAFASRLRMGLDPSRIVDEWFAEQRIEIIRKLTEARRKFVSAPIEEKEPASRAMADTFEEIQAILKRPRGEVVREIADKHGISPD